MGLHDIMIWAIIIVILVIQFKIYNKAKGKIQLFKKIMPSDKSFKTVKIYVREDELQQLKLEDVFDNLKEYTNSDTDKRNRKYEKRLLEKQKEEESKKYDPFKTSAISKDFSKNDNLYDEEENEKELAKKMLSEILAKSKK